MIEFGKEMRGESYYAVAHGAEPRYVQYRKWARTHLERKSVLGKDFIKYLAVKEHYFGTYEDDMHYRAERIAQAKAKAAAKAVAAAKAAAAVYTAPQIPGTNRRRQYLDVAEYSSLDDPWNYDLYWKELVDGGMTNLFCTLWNSGRVMCKIDVFDWYNMTRCVVALQCGKCMWFLLHLVNASMWIQQWQWYRWLLILQLQYSILRCICILFLWWLHCMCSYSSKGGMKFQDRMWTRSWTVDTMTLTTLFTFYGLSRYLWMRRNHLVLDCLEDFCDLRLSFGFQWNFACLDDLWTLSDGRDMFLRFDFQLKFFKKILPVWRLDWSHAWMHVVSQDQQVHGASYVTTCYYRIHTFLVVLWKRVAVTFVEVSLVFGFLLLADANTADRTLCKYL